MGAFLRITVFARRLAPYTVSFLRALAARGHAIELLYEAVAGEAPFAGFDLSCCVSARAEVAGDLHHHEWLQRADADLPDAAWIAGWTHPLERAAGRRLRRLGRPVVCGIDNPWRGTLRQWLGCVAAPWLLHAMSDRAWVAGPSQATFARRLGYRKVETGLYCADVGAYRCERPLDERAGAFLFTGRLVADKGFDLLIEAYRRYRQLVDAPLVLDVAGVGPLAALVEGQLGVRWRGFVQAADLPALMADSQALVLPSRVENWGVVIQEAAVAGLPVLASRDCGAASTYVNDPETGLLFAPTVEAIVDALLRFHALPSALRQGMSRKSQKLGLTLTPALQAQRFESFVWEGKSLR